MSTDDTPHARLWRAEQALRKAQAARDEARIERDRLVYEFRTHGELSDAAMAEILDGHRSWPQHLADAFPERLRRFEAAQSKR